HALRAARVAFVAAQPGLLAAPVHVQVRFPGVLAAGTEAEGAESGMLEGDVAGQDHQVGPGDLLPVLLLDRPQQAAGLVQADVVGPGVERGEALLATAAAATAVTDAVGAGAVPGHADHQALVAAEVGRPPVLRIGHQVQQVLLQRVVVQLPELLAVVEVTAQRIGLLRVLAQQVEPELVGPPVAVGGAAAGDACDFGVEWTLRFGRRHGDCPSAAGAALAGGGWKYGAAPSVPCRCAWMESAPCRGPGSVAAVNGRAEVSRAEQSMKIVSFEASDSVRLFFWFFSQLR